MVLEKTLESPLACKEIQPVHPKGGQSWLFIGRTDVEAETLNTLTTWCKELTHLKRPWCWEGLGAGGEGGDRGWHSWMASPALNMSLSKLRELVIHRGAWRAAVHGVAESQTQQWLNWTAGRETACNIGGLPWWLSWLKKKKKQLPTVWETGIQFLGWEDPLEQGKATHSSIVAWRIPVVHGVVESGMTERLSVSFTQDFDLCDPFG